MGVGRPRELGGPAEGRGAAWAPPGHCGAGSQEVRAWTVVGPAWALPGTPSSSSQLSLFPSPEAMAFLPLFLSSLPDPVKNLFHRRDTESHRGEQGAKGARSGCAHGTRPGSAWPPLPVWLLHPPPAIHPPTQHPSHTLTTHPPLHPTHPS